MLVKKIIKNLKIIMDNKVEDLALENILYALLAHLFSLKQVTFNSCNNLKKPYPITHYAVNFIGSGGQKNQTINNINDYVIPFIREEYKKINNEFSKKIIEEEIKYIDTSNKKTFNKEKLRILKKYENKTIVNFQTNTATAAKLYRSLEKIYRYRQGSLISIITEFSDYFKKSMTDNNSKEFLDTLNNLHDGRFEVQEVISDDDRYTLTCVPFGIAFLSDVTKLLEPQINDTFKENLATGYARRIFFYIDKSINYYKNPPIKPTIQEKKQAYIELEECCNKIKKIYDKLEYYQNFEFDEMSNLLLEEWEKNQEEELKEFYKYTDRLSIDEKIKVIELGNSTWKICKLAPLIQILKGDVFCDVTVESVKEAIDFYKKSRKCLYSLIEEKPLTEEEELFNYFVANINKPITLTQIKSQKFVNKNAFSSWFKEIIEIIKMMAFEKGLELKELKKTKNLTRYMLTGLINVPDDEKINISVSFSRKGDHPYDGYEYKEVNVDEFKDLIKTCTGLSAKRFKNGYRNDENVDPDSIQNTLWLDFDDGLKLEDAKEIFKPYWYVIYTSINHQKPKHDVTCDRFRVILKVKEPLPNDKETYNNILSNIIKKYNADDNAKGISRYFRGNKDAEIFTNQGGYFDWTPYLITENKIEKIQTYIPVTTNTSKCKNNNNRVLCDENFDNLVDKYFEKFNIVKGNREKGMSQAICALINMVNNKDLSHNKAISWVDNKLNEITTPDFMNDAIKLSKRIRELKI